ncbi:MAG TPA: hypothetical protein VLS88_10280 [Polyangiales bacterium]|nr:hypothetical protein [Polyangiales bacterium]
MSCNDCQDQIFELIEREAIDPDGVRAILEECPECRQLFDEMKDGLALAAHLPGEEPPASIDASLLRTAAARQPRRGAAEKRWLQAPPWAMAAVALLVVGIGVWVVPRAEETGQSEPAADDLVQAELRPAPTEEHAPILGAWASASGTVSAPVALTEAEVGAVGRPTKLARPEPSVRAKQRAKPSADEGSSEGASAGPVAGLMAEEAPAASRRIVSAECAARIARVEERNLDSADAEVEREEALAIGRCYRAAGNARAARAWLQRAAAHPETQSRARRALRGLADQ